MVGIYLSCDFFFNIQYISKDAFIFDNIEDNVPVTGKLTKHSLEINPSPLNIKEAIFVFILKDISCYVELETSTAECDVTRVC